MLHEFVTANRRELARRCRSKVSERVLEQLAWALRCEQESPWSERDRLRGPSRKTPAAAEVSRTAALHGKELREHGYTAGQVVQDYADISQAITELATERHAPVSAGEFDALNRFLDSAIADAVASYGGLTTSRELFANR